MPVEPAPSRRVTVNPGTCGNDTEPPPSVLACQLTRPTILATSGGYRPARRIRFEFADLLHYAVDLSGVSGRPSPGLPRRHGQR